MSTQVSSATVAVFPTFKGFRAATTTETRAAGQSGGRAFDSAFKAATANSAANITKGLQSQVRAATQALSKSRLAEADALGKTRAAQASYNETLSKYGTESARAISAEERLASTRRKSDEATAKVRAESDRLKTAQTQLAEATTKAGDAGAKGASRFAQGWASVKGKLTGTLKPAVDDASTKAARAAEDGGQRAGRGFSSGFKAAVGGLALLGGGAALAGFFRSANEEARESAAVGALTANAIKVTGAAAWTTADQVGDLATAISNKTGIDDEQIQSSANLLLTFKQVRNEVGAGANIFDRATAAAQDMAASGFGDADGAAKMLGKALNDPVKGVTALGRAGVTFTEQQKSQIKAMVASGDVLGAQKIIMAEVESQVGGAAEASANAAQKLATKWGNFKEAIGTALLPVVDATAAGLGKLLDVVGPKLIGVTERASSAILGLSAMFARGTFTADLGKAFGIEEDSPLVGLLVRIRDAIVGVFTAVGPLLASVSPLGMLVKAFADIGPAMATAMETGTGFGDVFTQLIGNLAGGASTLITNVAQLLVTLLPTLVAGLVPYLPGIATTLASAVTTVVQAVAVLLPTLIPILVQAAVGLFMALVQAVPLVIPPLIEGVVALLNSLVALLPALVPVLLQAAVALLMAIVQAVPIILPPLLQGAIGLIMAVVGALPTLIPALLDAAVALLTAIVNAIPVILPVLLDGAIALIMAVVDMLPTLIPALLDAAVSLLTAIINAVPVILPKLISAAIALIGAVLSLLPTLIPKLLAAAVALFTAMVNAVPKVRAALVSAVGSLIQGGINEIGKWGGRMLDSGKALIGGFVDGIKRGFDGAVSAVQNGLSNIRSYFPFSPARKGPFSGSGYTDRSGKALIADFAGGIADAGSQAINATARVMGRVQGQFQGLDGGALGLGASSTATGPGAAGSSLTRADLEGMTLHVDIDNGRGWFGREMAAVRAADLITSRAL